MLLGKLNFPCSSVSSLPPVQENWIPFLGQEDPLEKEMATHSSFLTWRIPWTKEPGRLQFMALQQSDTTERLSKSTRTHTHTHTHIHTQSYLGFRDKAEQASDFASNLPGNCPDWKWLGVTACRECKTFSTLHKMGEKSWNCWAPEGDLANQAPGLTTFQVLQDKTNRISMKLGSQ